MDQAKQPAAPAQILSFPQAAQIDGEMLETVLHNMEQGVLLFDSDTRMIFCNRRYMEMYGLMPEFARPGRYLRELLLQRVQTGTFTEDPDEYIARLKEGIAAGVSSTYTVNLADGRSFSVTNKPIVGGGWLATHEDITERQRIDNAAADRGRLLYTQYCINCHGSTAKGTDNGPDLIRSVVVLRDRLGNGIGPALRKSPHQATLTDAQVVDLSHFLHQRVEAIASNRGECRAPALTTTRSRTGSGRRISWKGSATSTRSPCAPPFRQSCAVLGQRFGTGRRSPRSSRRSRRCRRSPARAGSAAPSP